MRKEAILNAVLLLALQAVAAWAENCFPPVFYQSVPRDSDWYYGVGKDPDIDRARDLALINLGKQVTGSLDALDSNSMKEIIGQGVDRQSASETIGRLLPSSSLLAGWEQDAHDRCNGISYVLVRIGKERVERFIREDHKFKDEVLRSLNGTIAEFNGNVADLNQRLDALEKQNSLAIQQLHQLQQRQASKSSPVSTSNTSDTGIENHERIGKAIGVIRVQVQSHKAPSKDDLIALESLEQEFQNIRKSVEAVSKKHSESELKFLEAFKAKVAEGSVRMSDYNRAGNIYLLPRVSNPSDGQAQQELQEFHLSLAMMKRGFWGYLNPDFNFVRESGLVLALGDAYNVKKDWDLTIKLAQDYMIDYPEGGAFSGMEKFLKDAMQKKREAAISPKLLNEEAAAPSAVAEQVDADAVAVKGQRHGPIALPRPSLLTGGGKETDAEVRARRHAQTSMAGPGAPGSSAAPGGTP